MLVAIGPELVAGVGFDKITPHRFIIFDFSITTTSNPYSKHEQATNTVIGLTSSYYSFVLISIHPNGPKRVDIDINGCLSL